MQNFTHKYLLYILLETLLVCLWVAIYMYVCMKIYVLIRGIYIYIYMKSK